MSGVGEASALAGFVSLSIQLLNGCFQGFEILCRAYNCERYMSSLQLMLEIELCKLFVWADEVGLLRNPPLLDIGLPYAHMVPKILRELRDLLNDVHKLRSRYRMRLEVTSQQILDVQHTESAFRRLSMQSQPDVKACKDATKLAFDKRASPWHRLRWVAVDETRFKELLQLVGGFIKSLQEFMDFSKRQNFERRHDALLRSTVMSTGNQYDLHLISQRAKRASIPSSNSLTIGSLSRESRSALIDTAISATAQLKQKGLRIGLFSRYKKAKSSIVTSAGDDILDITGSPMLPEPPTPTNSDSKPPHPTRLETARFRLLKTSCVYGSRQLARYDDKLVLLEWRNVDRFRWEQMKSRVEKLTYLLQQMTDASFHSLTCLGWVSNSGFGQYGYVFELPLSVGPPLEVQSKTSEVQDLCHDSSIRTLRDAFITSSSCPSLNIRVNYAIMLLETILQLHTAGWLHKQIRSENILLMGESPQSDLKLSHDERSFYLSGYTYTRADDPQDFTEIIRSDPEADIYRHPASLQMSRHSDQHHYRKGFDIFSTGCVLLELGLWSSLSTILCNIGNEDDSNVLATRLKRQDTWMTDVTLIEHSSTATPPETPPLDKAVPHTVKTANTTKPLNTGLDLMKARASMLRQLHSSSVTTKTQPPNHEKSSTSSSEKAILHQLEACAGRAFAGIVLECLLTGVTGNGGDKEGENMSGVNIDVEQDMEALALESRILQKLRNLADVL